MTIPPPRSTPRRRCRGSGLALLALALAGFLALPAAAAQNRALTAEEAAAFEVDGPVVRRLLERAAAAEAERGRPGHYELAATLYCKAARYGSLEGVYRLGRLVLAGNGVPRNPSMAATLFSIASGNGHYRASWMVLLTGVHEDQLPRCLVEPLS